MTVPSWCPLLFLVTTPKMDTVCIVSGELYGDFAGEATFNDHGGANQSSGDDSVGKQQEKKPTFGEFSEESTYTYYDDELGKKKVVNSTGSRLNVPRLSNHLSLPGI